MCEAQDEDADQVAHNSDGSNTGYEHKVQDVLDPADLGVCFASSLSNASVILQEILKQPQCLMVVTHVF